MSDRPPKVRRGEPRRASTFNKLRDFAASKLQLEVEPPLTLKPEGAGRVLSAATDDRIFALLSGATSPYSIVQKRRVTSTHSWATVSGGIACTGCAYEINGQAGLAGKVVELERDATAGLWLFGYNRWKPPCTSAIQVKVTGCCNLALAGSAVTVKQGGVLVPGGSGTTGSDGKFTVGALSAGTYDVAATKATFSGTATASVVVPSCQTSLVTVNLSTPADPTNYVCAGCCCADPMPRTGTLTDTNGSYTVTWSADVPGGAGWWVAYDHTFVEGFTFFSNPYVGVVCKYVAPCLSWVAWNVGCGNGGFLYYPNCVPPSGFCQLATGGPFTCTGAAPTDATAVPKPTTAAALTALVSSGQVKQIPFRGGSASCSPLAATLRVMDATNCIASLCSDATLSI
jgi:hypothetical protein